MEWNETLTSFLAALGLGLLNGVIRERRNLNDEDIAGTRTHALVAVLGFVTWSLGPLPFVACLGLVGALTVAGYLQTAHQDRGLTGEVALLVSLVLGALAFKDAHLAVAVAVVCAILLYAKQPLHRFSQELVSERELQDALMLAAAALVVMPLLPQGALDPWGVLKPYTLWRIVVLVMAVGMLGHVAMRALGARWGLPIAGFFSGFASSTATVAGMGQRARLDPDMAAPAAAAALLANIASLLLFGAVIAAASPALLHALMWPMLAGVAGLVGVTGLVLLKADMPQGAEPTSAHAYKVSHALLLAGLIAGVSLVAAWLGQIYGDTGVLVAATLVGLAEIHAAAASIAQVSASGGMSVNVAAWGMTGALAASVLAKTVLALFSGGVNYGWRVAVGLLAMLAGMAGAMLLRN